MFTARVLFCSGLLIALAEGVVSPISRSARIRRSSSMSKQTTPTCKDGNPSSIAVNTTQRLSDLRAEMMTYNYQGYIVPSNDAHLSEYIAPSEKKRRWLTGFTGSAGTAVVTLDKAALWTDGRYFEQAAQQLDCNWILMREGETGVPSIEEWLASELRTGDYVGANPFLFSIAGWQSYAANLASDSVMMTEAFPDLIDLVWVEDRPEATNGEIIVFPIEYSGTKWQDKLEGVRAEMTSRNADYLLITRLDETAWLFNMRGNDIPYTPVFTSYALVGVDSNPMLFVNDSRFEPSLPSHLNPLECNATASCVHVMPYERARPTLSDLADMNYTVWMPGDGTSYGMFSAVNVSQQISEDSSITLQKSIKNNVEVAAMKQAHIYDAVALCEYLQWLEVNVPSGTVDEISGADKLERLRLAQPTSKGPSFGSISASGPNSAIIHYGATPETNRSLTTSEMYMIDSGGQYFEGTTDVTRTWHFGYPSPFQVETFTRALQGLIDVEMAIFPAGKSGNDLDILARRPLYEIGLDYRHGTGHGVGQYLCIHEYPPGIGLGGSYAKYGDTALQPGMFSSVEPGYYQEGEFGLRHENLDVVEEYVTENQFGSYVFYSLNPVTLVPFYSKLIDTKMMSDQQLEYLNSYHRKVMNVVGNECLRQNKTDLYHWIGNATVALTKYDVVASAPSLHGDPTRIIFSTMAILFTLVIL